MCVNLENEVFSVATESLITQKSNTLMKASFQHDMLFVLHAQLNTRKFPVPMRLGETPVHIPNTMVKTQAADDTILETIWESRWVPDLKRAYSSAG